MFILKFLPLKVSIQLQDLHRSVPHPSQEAAYGHPEIEVKYVSQITGFDLNCKERLEMVSLGVALSPWQDVPDTAEPCQDTLDNHIKGNKHNKERLK